MINDIHYGWLDLTLCGYSFSASYLTNAVKDLIKCFIEYKDKGESQVWLDGEGINYTFVINSNDDMYLIVGTEAPKVYREDDKTVDKLIQELLNDFKDETLLNEASKFYMYDNEDKEDEEYKKLKDLLNELKSKLI